VGGGRLSQSDRASSALRAAKHRSIDSNAAPGSLAGAPITKARNRHWEGGPLSDVLPPIPIR